MTRLKNVALAALTTIALTACGNTSGRDTRTIELAHMSPEQAQLLIEPYIDGGGATIRRTERPAALTVTASRGRLDQIEELLERYDRPAPKVRLRFQILEADGYTTTDSAIADVESALRELFRFRGYRLAGESIVSGEGRTEISQRLTLREDIPVDLTVFINDVSSGTGGKAVELRVSMTVFGSVALQTGVTVPDGQTVVLGSSRPVPNLGSLILVVRPHIE